MPVARRICAVLTVNESGRPRVRFNKGGLEADFVEAIASFLERDGADEIWLRLDQGPLSRPGQTAPSAHPQPALRALYGPLAVLEQRIFVPVVAWAPIPAAADARLLLSFGADRVVVDASLGLPDPIGHFSKICQAVGRDRVTAALPVRRMVSERGVSWELVDGDGKGSGINALTLAERLAGVGVGEVLVVSSVPAPNSERVVHDGELIEELTARLSIPLLSFGEDRDAADLATALMMGADGVASPLFQTGAPTVKETKTALAGYDLALVPVED